MGLLEIIILPCMNQKITPNNVWNLDIIDTFTSEETKIEDAGGLIANAALLYSSRVDDVASKTNKLIENFSLTVKKKKNLATLGETNKEFTESQWAGGELKKILKDGITTQYNKNGYAIPKANSVFFFPCAEIGVAIKNKTVCPWANKIEYKEEVEIANSVSFAENQTDFFIGNNSVEQEVKIEVPDNKISQNDISEPIMMKGWAGPTFWKLPAKKNNNKPVKKREKSSLDFTQYVDRNMMFQQGDNLLPLTAIKERKKHSYILPVDYKVSLNELYKYITIDGSFRSTNAQLPDDNITSAERAFVPAENDMIDDQNQTVVIPENDQEVVTDFGNVKSVEMARSLFKKCNAVQNKLDINKLKTDITNMVECDNAISLSKLCENVRSNHPEKNVSLQYCIVGLLHLANEKNYKLTKDGENIIINKD